MKNIQVEPIFAKDIMSVNVETDHKNSNKTIEPDTPLIPFYLCRSAGLEVTQIIFLRLTNLIVYVYKDILNL